MKLPYYEKNILQHAEITQSCPGCGRMDKLSMRSKVNSYAHNLTEYYIGCNCGWLGPTANTPFIAVMKWETREIIRELAEERL